MNDRNPGNDKHIERDYPKMANEQTVPYEQYKALSQAQSLKSPTVKEILVHLVVQCEISREKDKERSYMKSQHEFYSEALSSLAAVLHKAMPTKEIVHSDWCNGFNSALYEVHQIIDKLLLGKGD